MDADAVAEISTLLGTEVASLKSEFAVYFEKLLEETARMVDQATDKGLHRNITNLTFRRLWRDFFTGAGETVTHQTFATGVENFMLDELHMTPDDIAEIWNTDAVTNVRKAIDRNSDGSVRVASDFASCARAIPCDAVAVVVPGLCCRFHCTRLTQWRSGACRSWIS